MLNFEPLLYVFLSVWFSMCDKAAMSKLFHSAQLDVDIYTPNTQGGGKDITFIS